MTKSSSWDRHHMARLIAADIPEGSVVNIGIGMPELVATYLPKDKDIFLHSENGVIGMGPPPDPDQVDPDLINAGKQPVTLQAGGAFFDHSLSFAMMRGGHLDIAILGAFQVSATGDIANWSTGAPEAIPAVGGAMDLAVGARSVFVMMDLLTKEGKSKLVRTCTYPLTGVGCVTRIYTDLGVFDVTPGGFSVRDRPQGVTLEMLQGLTGLTLR